MARVNSFSRDVGKQSLVEFDNVASEDLVQKVDQDSGNLPLTILTPDAEGESAIQYILQRDETVVPLLAEKFPDYTPGVTVLKLTCLFPSFIM